MNATQTAHSLLSLPSGGAAPDPYTVLGLVPGDSDAAKISAAIKAVVARLNGVKATADPAAWNQAAIWVKEARRVLTDPVLKQQLDQKLIGTKKAAAPPIPKVDPLAAFLPGAVTGQQQLPPGPPVPAPSQFGGMSPSNSAFRAGNAPPAPAAPQPPGFAAPSGFDQPQSPHVPAPTETSWPPVSSGGTAVGALRELDAIGKPKSPGHRRKKRFPWASLILVGLTLASIGGIVAMVVYLNKNPGGITIALQPGVDGAVPVAGSDIAVAPPAQRDDAPRDSIMGRLGPPQSDRNSNPNTTGEVSDDWLADIPANDGDSTMDQETPAPPAMNPEDPAMQIGSMPSASTMTDPSMANIPDGDAPPTEVPNMATIPGVTEPTAEQLEAAQAALQKARQAISTAQWTQMNTAAEAAVTAAATEEQKKMADQLVHLAEVASYYHVGVEKALDGLKASETFNVTEQLQIAVVEITPTKVTLRFNGRNKDYARSELPLVIAHKIASFSMPVDSPATQIAAQAYQAIAPVTTPPYRDQAIKTLEAMPAQPDDVDPADLVAAIRQVFPQ